MKSPKRLSRLKPRRPEFRPTAASRRAGLNRLQQQAELEAALERAHQRFAPANDIEAFWLQQDWLAELEAYGELTEDDAYHPDNNPMFRLFQRIDRAFTLPVRRFSASRSPTSHAKDRSRFVAPTEFEVHGHLAGALARHVEDLYQGASGLLARWDELESRLGGTTARERMRAVLDGRAGVSRTRLVCLFAPFWIRSPETWKGGTARSLLEHLFTIHRVPVWLHTCWAEGAHKFICWFILLGQGGDLGRAGARLGWRIAPAFTRSLFEVHRTPCGLASMAAEVHRLGGGSRVVNALLRSEVLALDPTNFDATGLFANSQWRAALRVSPETHWTQSADMWRTTVRWLVRNIAELRPEQCGWLLRWAVHEYFEGQRDGRDEFSWSGRTAHDALEEAKRYRRIYERSVENTNWSGHGWEWRHDSELGVRWTFQELTTAEALVRERVPGWDDVSRDAKRCAYGDKAHVAMQRNGLSCVTIATARPRSCANRCRRSRTVRPLSESSAAVGSSARMIGGSPASARAIAMRCFWPPLRSAGYASILDARPT